jgi:hypothetical protein
LHYFHLIFKKSVEEKTKIVFLKIGVIQTWNQEGRQYLRQFATDEVNVKAELAQLSPSHQHRHDAPLRSVTT